MKAGLPIRLGAGLILMLGLVIPASAQKAQEPYGAWVSATFARYKMELPKLAWLVPPRTIIAREKAAALWIWSEADQPARADYRARLTPGELRDYRRSESIACGRAPEHDRYELATPLDVGDDKKQPGEPHGDPVLYTTRRGIRIIGDALIGDATEEELSRAARSLGIPDGSTRSKGFNVASSDFVFTFAGFYDSETGDMLTSGLLLSNRAGTTIASQSWEVSPDTVCEGCAVPQYDDALEDTFGLLNVVRVPHFPYPVLLEDSGTDDEDALSLVTFSAQKTYAEYRVYESFEGCDELVPPDQVIAGRRLCGTDTSVCAVSADVPVRRSRAASRPAPLDLR